MGLGDMLSMGFKILTGNPIVILPFIIFFVLVGVVAAALIFLIVGSAALGGTLGQLSVFALASLIVGKLWALVIGSIVLALLIVFVQGMYISIADQGMSGKVSLGKAFGVAKEKYLSLLGLDVLLLIVWGVLLGIFISLNIFVLVKLGLITVPIDVILAIFGIWLIAALFLTGPEVVLGNKGPIEAVRQSIADSKNRKVQILALLFASGIVIGIIGTVAGIVGGILLAVPTVGLVLFVLWWAIYQAFLYAYGMLMAPIFYRQNNIAK